MVCVVGWLQEHDISHHFIFKHCREHPQIYQVAKFLAQIVLINFFFLREFQLMISTSDDSSFIIRLRHQLIFSVDKESIN